MEHFESDGTVNVGDILAGVEEVFAVRAVGIVDLNVIGCVVGVYCGIPVHW